jgi:hypothetical protein
LQKSMRFYGTDVANIELIIPVSMVWRGFT